MHPDAFADTDTDPTLCDRAMGAALWSLPGSVIQEMLGARAWFRKVHEQTGVRMAFLCCGAWLVQWYEGTPAAVDFALERARQHPAQRNFRLLHRSRGEAFLPDAIHIASLHDGASAAQVARRIYRAEREHALGWLAEPSDIWQSLGAPSRVHAGGAPGAAVARRGLALLTSEYNECFDVLKAVADRAATTPAYQRFAGDRPRSGDVGAAYIDLDSGNHVTRLQALSRAALANRMVRLGVQDTHCIVLLVGDRPHAARALGEEVRDWLESEAMRPDVWIMGPDPEAAHAAAQALRGCASRPRIGIAQAGVPGRSRTDALLQLLADAPRPQARVLERQFG